MAKEKLTHNTPPATLFVGVGGIGSGIVRKVAERCKKGEADNLRFVAMDTNANDLREIGESNAVVTSIQTSSTRTVLDYLKDDSDARNHWFPNNTILYPKTVSEGAGQVRAISRLALNATIKTNKIAKLYKAIDNLFLKDGGEYKQALRVVIVSSAAGGTGSGIAMIVGMLIRNYLQKHYSERSAIIRGYLLLPGVLDSVIPTENERESLRRNGYATIKEINAFMIKSSGFCGVRKELERYAGLHIEVPNSSGGTEKLENLPFDFCFLLDKVSQSEESLETLEQYKELAAQSLYEQNIGPMQQQAFSMEDNVIKEFSSEENFGRNRFGALGASILRYPYEDIADYVAYGRAIERIGGAESAGDWLKYDKEYEKIKAEFKKKRAVTNNKEPQLADTYITELENDNKRFGVDIKGYLASDISRFAIEAADLIDGYISNFDDEILRYFVNLPNVIVDNAQVANLTKKVDYEKKPEYRNKAEDNLSTLRRYEGTVKALALSTARQRAKAILLNGPVVSQDVENYNLESLLKTKDGCMHPNAVRYVLYALKNKLNTILDEIKPSVNSKEEALKKYAPNVDNENLFDLKLGFNDNKEKNFDDVCALEKKDPTWIEKIGGYPKVWDAFNKHFPGYSSAVIDYRNVLLKKASYETALQYISELCAEYEKFYDTFESKTVKLDRKRDEIVEKLQFKKGDSVMHVCSKKEYLEKLAKSCPEGNDGLLLPDDLNAEIFETIKSNAESRRLSDLGELDNKGIVDIFDSVLLEYFKNTVRSDCDVQLDMNIIRAIEKEQEYELHVKANELNVGKEIDAPKATDSQKLEYIKEYLMRGERLSAAGVGFANFDEPRDITVCAFNKQLEELLDIDVKKTIESLTVSPNSGSTVSKYDFRFFKALYNVTPEKLSRFKSGEKCEESDVYSEAAGIYYKAYHDYIKLLGPDSTKCARITLHIDKRWDSLTELPEISLDAQYEEMVRIHSALVYGLVHGMVKTTQLSKYDKNKRNYVLEDSEGDLTKLVVSNNTECDEFYEILDALYRDRATVAKIYEMVDERCKFDLETNRRYAESAFIDDTATFKIGDGHDAPTSLFEIPLMYYNSLPRTKLDDNELGIMIDSVINVIETEVNKYEQVADRAPLLAHRLEEQFKLLVDNFNDDKLNVNDCMRKNTILSENLVVNMALKKISNKMKSLNVYQFSERIKDLRKLVK